MTLLLCAYQMTVVLLQALQAALRQRHAEHSQRLSAAAATAKTLHVQAQHIRGVAAAAAAAAAAANTDDQQPTAASSLLQDSQASGGQPCTDAATGRRSPRSAQHVPRSPAAAAAAGDGVSGAGVSGEAAMRLLLPSSGASAAAAIAASRSDVAANLPSRVARAEVGWCVAVACASCSGPETSHQHQP
jgi:hypothetical protein